MRKYLQFIAQYSRIKYNKLKKVIKMTINYGSPSHIAYILIALVFAFALYFVFRGRSKRAQKILILTLMCLNVIQHVFKSYIYPQHFGEGFNALTTAYNMCATLILLSPIVFLTRVKFLRDFVFYGGAVAGMIAILVPYWNIGMSALSWEVYRFFICHALLFASSLLTLLFGFHKASFRSAFGFAPAFFLAIGVIILNDIICIKCGAYIGTDGLSLLDALYFVNPTWSFGPPESFAWLLSLAEALAPDVLVYMPDGRCVPVLWYFIPIFIIMTLVGLVVCALTDKEGFRKDMQKLRAMFKK